ncbi:DUF1326 domain-containing protein [Hoeflea sp. 108]|uniref:DUF1326 domain-containing protein n=1 Tax=Hoeflea sp. 108 TaxID=1116369 RepID=UPI001FDA4DD3|nr:DUF1326 domain-containing protein [Hoeflea sp. 108]
MNAVPQWSLAGDWFDICSCDIPCPCEFAQRPTGNHCQGVLACRRRHSQHPMCPYRPTAICSATAAGGSSRPPAT